MTILFARPPTGGAATGGWTPPVRRGGDERLLRGTHDEAGEPYPRPFTRDHSDGVLRHGLFPLEPPPGPGRSAHRAMIAAAGKLLAGVTPAQARRLRYGVDAPRVAELGQSRIHAARHGPRLDELRLHVRDGPGRPGSHPQPGRLRAGPRADADQRLPRRPRGAARADERVQLQLRPLRRTVRDGAVGVAALWPPRDPQRPRGRTQLVISPCTSAPNRTSSTPDRAATSQVFKKGLGLTGD